MEVSEITTLALGGAVVGLVFKEKIKATAAAVKDKLQLRNKQQEDLALRAVHGAIASLISRTHSSNMELNHIKGQLQEVLQELKTPQSISVPKDPLVVDMHGDLKAVFERLNLIAKQVSDVQGSTEYLESAVKTESERNSAKLYTEGLAGLANASSAILERQVASEKLLADIVNVLTRSDS